MEELVDAGLARQLGVCNFGVEDLKRALATGTKIVSNQICYNLIFRAAEFEVLPFCHAHGIPFSRQRFYSFAGVPVRDIFVAGTRARGICACFEFDYGVIINHSLQTIVPGFLLAHMSTVFNKSFLSCEA